MINHIYMQPILKIPLIVLAGFALLLAVLVVVVAGFDWNRARPWINDRVSESLERQFAINGELAVRWEFPDQAGLSGWIPRPHIRAQDVTLANPEWASTGPTMLRLPQVEVLANPLPLLKQTLSLVSLRLSEPQLILEQDKQSRNNWTFPDKDKKEDSDWQLDLQTLVLIDGGLRYVDATKNADVKASIATLEDGRLDWKMGGIFNDEKLSGNGKAGVPLALRKRDVKYPVDALLKVGETTITAEGTLTHPARPKALDLDLKILGASMADLFPLSGVLLPETPKFSTEGRVIGDFAKDEPEVRYENFKGKVGVSDIGGTLTYIAQDPRPILKGEVSSSRLDIKDVLAIVGGGDNKKQKRGEVKQPKDKVLPVSPFRTERWNKMDVQIDFAGKKIVGPKAVALDDLHTKFRMDNAQLSIAPLNFGVAGGRLTTEIRIDGRGKPAKARMNVSAKSVKLKNLFPEIEEMQASIGEINGSAELSAAGNSFADLLGSSNGEVRSLIDEGSVSKFVLEAMGLNIGAIVATKLFGDSQVKLNCMATDFGVRDGLMQTRTFVVDTEDATIYVDGTINLASEQLKLRIQPESKGVRLISLRSPLYVTGTFKNPEVGVDEGAVAAKAGTAVVLGAVAAPLAGLLALVNPGPEEDSPCAELLAKAKKKPDAPPPGKKESGDGAAKKQEAAAADAK